MSPYPKTFPILSRHSIKPAELEASKRYSPRQTEVSLGCVIKLGGATKITSILSRVVPDTSVTSTQYVPEAVAVKFCVVAPVFHKNVAPVFPASNIKLLPQTVVSGPKLTMGCA